MARYLPIIAWETEVWTAEAPSHLIHFNGERFLGPYAQDGRRLATGAVQPNLSYSGLFCQTLCGGCGPAISCCPRLTYAEAIGVLEAAECRSCKSVRDATCGTP